MITIKELKEFINENGLPDDTVVNISKDFESTKAKRLSVITHLNSKPIKHELSIADYNYN